MEQSPAVKFFFKRSNPYLPVPMRIKDIRVESEDGMLKTFDLEFVSPEDKESFKFLPGQFCEVSILGKGEAPFGIASAPTEQDYVRFTVNRAGLVTNTMHQLDAGDPTGMRGPLGNWYPLGRFKGSNLVIVSGGFAFTTLRSVIRWLLDGHRADYKNVTVIYGARTPGMLLYKDELEEWSKRDDISIHLTVDKEAEGWKGLVGFVPTVTEKIAPSPNNALLLMCGPPAMIRYTLPVVTKLGFKPEQIYTSLERRMKCGIGKCGRCNIGHYYVCKDGPVFSLDQLEALPHEY
ncbi:heterodisulfide reductase subunit F [candidate division TA06 bacterium B3_TA06]|uniref:Heterodisulfide reductase subunit F n=1 Tax=candidate division TA06 bacterium B3_TA06 TaxID=2012487 RepID=A0A532V032_UNCT6|nr:MAG: heterodisulfide reductase subunit F [candidate division TA06 bacterium B3_TA06]